MSFRFKQFFIEDDRCAMKVGTDGVLLGAWAPTGTRILDIGTGCGLIARMMMQRCPEADVEGIDIDEAAVEQARENGVKAFCSSLQDWQIVNRQSSNRQLYDLIVSNPPYFQNSLKNPDEGRKTARHTDSLSYEELIAHSLRLLAPEGVLALILPADAEQEIVRLAQQAGLRLVRLTRVFSKEGKPARRVLLAFENTRSRDLEITTVEDVLILEDEKGGRSAAYSQLCQEFYL